MSQAKQFKCKACGEPFTKARALQKVCGHKCAVTLAQSINEKKREKAEREDRKATRAKLDAMRTKPQLTKLAQTAFNAFIRARDAGKPCISCGTPLAREAIGGAFDCGHYRSVGSAVHMRFVEDNAHGQCKHCNNHLAGNHVRYRQGLIERIGIDRVEQLEADQTLRKYTPEGLKAIAAHYRAKAREILKGRE